MPAEGDSADIPNLGRRVPLGGIRDGAAILDRFLAWVQKLWITKMITGSKVYGIYQRITSLGFGE